MTGWNAALDWNLLGWIHDHFSSGFWDVVMLGASWIGNYAIIWVFAACLLLYSKRTRWQGIALLAALITGFLIGNVLMKPLFARIRPSWPYDAPALLFPAPVDYSFPSGHALSSFSAALVLTRTNKKFGWFALPLAILIALSRLYLYAHFPSDVLVGSIIGSVNGACVYSIGKRLAGRARSKVD